MTTDLQTQLHGMWGAVAGGWGVHAEYVDHRGAAVTAAMLDTTAPAPGGRVLELACGPASVGLAAAERVGPTGTVVLSDVAPEMVAIAAARAEASGWTNVETRVLDLEAIAVPDASFDVVVCREGLMFAVDPLLATCEIHRVLRPDGRAAIAVWGPRAENPWLSIVFDTVGAQLGVQLPPPGIPGPFALDDADRVRTLLTEASFDDVAVTALATPLHARSFDEWWTRTVALAGPLAGMVAGLPEGAASDLRTRLIDAVEPYGVDGGLEFPGLTLLATGTA